MPLDKRVDDDDDKSSESSLRLGSDDSAEPDRERVPRSRPETPTSTQDGYNHKKSRVGISRGSHRASEEEPERAAKKMRSEVSHVNNAQDWLDSQIPDTSYEKPGSRS